MSGVDKEVPREMRFLKGLVIFFALILVAAAGFLIVVGVGRMEKPGFDIAHLPIPKGCEIEQMTTSDDKLIFSLAPGLSGNPDDCRRVLIADMTTGKLIGQFDLTTSEK